MNQTQIQRKKEIVQYFLSKNILVSNDVLETVQHPEQAYQLLTEKVREEEVLFLNNDIYALLEQQDQLDLNWQDLERLRVLFEKERNKDAYTRFIHILQQKQHEKPTEAKAVCIVYSYEEYTKKREIQDFVQFFNHRYRSLRKLLLYRQELQGITSISRIKSMGLRETTAVIGMVVDKQITKNNNFILTLEDTTGEIKVLVNKQKPELFPLAEDIVLDEVIGVTGITGNNILFANSIVHPDIPAKGLQKSSDGAHALFLSDLHVGSELFLEKKFNKFIQWLNQETGSDAQKAMAGKVKYLFIVGDLVDGVGVYPGQEKELAIKDIYAQYEKCANLLSKIPKDIALIVCPGNHDAMRIAEPQPKLYRDLTEPLWQLPNITMVSNPAVVNIHANGQSSGFDVLLYHGYSFDYFIANVDSIRNKGGYDRADLVMKFLLQRRHLAPTHQSTLYIPDPREDPLVISRVPDFFVTGHLHKAAVANYKNTTMICSSCWQAKTDFQEKLGHNPEPARVPIVNLQTRETKLLRF